MVTCFSVQPKGDVMKVLAQAISTVVLLAAELLWSDCPHRAAFLSQHFSSWTYKMAGDVFCSCVSEICRMGWVPSPPLCLKGQILSTHTASLFLLPTPTLYSFSHFKRLLGWVGLWKMYIIRCGMMTPEQPMEQKCGTNHAQSSPCFGAFFKPNSTSHADEQHG